jgi:hypothetical protein
MSDIEKYNWSKWRPFPHPHNKGILVSPYGFGIYQLKNIKTNEFTMFGRGDHLSHRMSTILPVPFGISGRRNMNKKDYVLSNINDIEYRTILCNSHEECVQIENEIKKLKIHKFNT